MAFNAVSLARQQHYDGLALSGVHALGSTSMHHINTPRLAATVCSREASMYFTPESVCSLARRRTINSGPLYTSVIDDIPEDPFSGYLSDISEDTTFSDHADVPQLARTQHESQRRYLNKSIAVPMTNDIQGWSQSTVAYTPPALKVTRGASLKALGRRLSLSIMPNAVPGRIRANTQPLAQAPRTSYIAERSESQWSLQPKKRTSWLDSIKRRIQGVRSRGRADAEAMAPITAYWGAECREPIDDDPEAGPTGLYPRLRSQPSLSPTSDASPVRARDDASFVPDIDIVRAQPPTPTPQRHPRKARFLLPHRHSIVSSAQYGVLD